MYLVTVLYGDGSSQSHLASDAVDARIWEEAYPTRRLLSYRFLLQLPSFASPRGIGD